MGIAVDINVIVIIVIVAIANNYIILDYRMAIPMKICKLVNFVLKNTILPSFHELCPSI